MYLSTFFTDTLKNDLSLVLHRNRNIKFLGTIRIKCIVVCDF